jgi:type VI secretion system protein ImpB
MARASSQTFIRRNRPPRVHITYENPTNAEEKVEIPFVMGVMSDLSGNTPGVDKEDIAERKLLDFDMDNLDARMSAMQPGVSFRVGNKISENADEQMSVQLRFNKMADFEPAAVARQVPALAKLLQARQQLTNLMRYMDGKVAAEESLRKLLSDPQLMNALKSRASDTGNESDGSS